VANLEAKKRGDNKIATIIDYYFPVYEFDVKHLTSESQARVPQFFTTVVGDHEALYQHIVQAVTKDGYSNSIQEAALRTEERRGYSLHKDIYIERRMASGKYEEKPECPRSS
jgi:hypothetical protein